MGREPLSVILVDPSSIRMERLAEALGHDTRFDLLGKLASLNEAYNITETAQPDFVVISMDIVVTKEYPMFAAMLDILDAKQIVVANKRDDFGGLAGTARLVSVAQIEAVGGLGELIAEQAGLAPPNLPADLPEQVSNQKLVVIGASTGGIEALATVLKTFPQDCPPTLIVQHIRARFTPSMIQRLDRTAAPRVLMAQDRLPFQSGQVLVAPGDAAHLLVHPRGRRCCLAHSQPVSGHRPSVDALFNSAADSGLEVVAALLTGMGRDGALGLARIRKAGGWTIAQDQASCTVYGMPKAAVEMGAVREQLPLHKIGEAILAASQHQKGRLKHVRG